MAIRTRYKTYRDYGFAEGEEQVLKGYICGQDFREEVLLRRCCEKANIGISNFLFESLRQGKGYDKISQVEYVPIGRNDFYGWQRKALALFKRETDAMKGNSYKGELSRIAQNCPERRLDGEFRDSVSASAF